MTRKDYVALAEALRGALPKHRLHDLPGDVWLDCMEAIADVLAKDNLRFDRERFIAHAQGLIRADGRFIAPTQGDMK